MKNPRSQRTFRPFHVRAVLVMLALCLSALCLSPAFAAPPPDTTAAAGGPHHRGPRPPSYPILNPAQLAAEYRAVAAFTADSIPQEYVAVGSVRGYVYVLKRKGPGFTDSWSTFYLGAPVKKILADDIDADGIVELVALTTAGKMYVFDTASRQRVWESTANDFENASEFLVAQLDPDPEKEIVLCADSQLLILDGETLSREYQSADPYNAEYMVIGDVDNDGEDEIVLDSGFIINARTLNMEWQTDFFGTRLSLVDVDGDRVPELVSESTGGAIRIYDLDTRQEKTVF